MLATNLPTTAYNLACNYGSNLGSPTASLNAFGWIQINLLVIIAGFMIAALVYMLSGFFPVSMREKLRGVVKYEYFQMTLGIVILLALIAFSSTTCRIGQALAIGAQPVGHILYSDPMQWSQSYLSNLLFVKGFSLFSNIYAESQLIVFDANIMDTAGEIVSSLLVNPFFGTNLNPGLLAVYFAFSSTLTSTFVLLMVVAFGVIFVIYMFLPIIQAMALTVVVPLTLILRSVPFAGPRLRESADSIMGLAIGFYFILPLVLILNQYIITWLYTPCIIQTSLNGLASTHPQFLLCNPYYEFTGSYKLINIPVDSFFTSSPSTLASGVQGVGVAGLVNGVVPSFFGGAITGAGGAGPFIQKIFGSLFGLPQVIIAYSQEVSQYLFEGIVLIGIDMAITIGFAQGLSKGFGSVSRIIGTGPFWGNI